MTNYGRAGLDDFKPVTGAQGILGIGSELYQVPMFEQKADPAAITITTKDAGQFTVDPTYTFAAVRGKGKYIVYAYKHVGTDDMLNRIAEQILNPIVLNAYREEARSFTTDSLMNHLNQYESNAEIRLKKDFNVKYFDLLSLT